MKKILVTGGMGFIGSNLVLELDRLDYNIVVVDNLSSARPDYSEVISSCSNVELVKSCFSDNIITDRVESKEFETVFHVAAIPRVSFSVEQPYLTTNVNVDKTVKLLECCRGNISNFIFSSSSSVYGGADVLPTPNNFKKDPKSPYAWQKSCIEDICKIFCNLYEMNIICLRYFNVFGPGQYGDSAYATAVSAWCNAIKKGLPLRSDGSGCQSRDLCYVDNVVNANVLSMLAMASGKKFNSDCLNVACGDRTSNNEILDYLSGKFKNLEIKNAQWRAGDVMHTQADISNTKSLIGYEPSVSFWDGLDKTLKWWKLS